METMSLQVADHDCEAIKNLSDAILHRKSRTEKTYVAHMAGLTLLRVHIQGGDRLPMAIIFRPRQAIFQNPVAIMI
jgi:hypothetical protein